MTSPPLYHPYFCEENVWHLACSAPTLGIEAPHVVFVSSPTRAVGMWAQRAGSPIVWDYHVVLLGRTDRWRIWDLDTVAGFPLTVPEWVEATFPFTGAVPPELEPYFRVIEAAEFLAGFRSDRRHMRDGEVWKSPPPPWPAISPEDFNLWEFVDMSTPSFGALMDLDGFLEAYR